MKEKSDNAGYKRDILLIYFFWLKTIADRPLTKNPSYQSFLFALISFIIHTIFVKAKS